jgi:hypothetical protein
VRIQRPAGAGQARRPPAGPAASTAPPSDASSWRAHFLCFPAMVLFDGPHTYTRVALYAFLTGLLCGGGIVVAVLGMWGHGWREVGGH